AIEDVHTDVGAGRVVVRVERTNTGDTLVLNVLAVGKKGGAVGEGGALLAAVGTGDRSQVVRDGLTVVRTTLDRGESSEDGGVVRLSGVREVGQLLRSNALEALLEVVGRVRTGDGALRALDRACGQVGREVGGVAVGEVQLVTREVGGKQLRQDLLGLVERNDHD